MGCRQFASFTELHFATSEHYSHEIRRLEINRSSEGTGEFRGGKDSAQSGASHRYGVKYTWIQDSPPIGFDVNDIVWPDGWKLKTVLAREYSSNGEVIARKPLTGAPGEVD